MTSLEIRALGVVALVLSFVLALAVVAMAAALVALTRRAHLAIRARRAARSVPAPARPVARLKEAA